MAPRFKASASGRCRVTLRDASPFLRSVFFPHAPPGPERLLMWRLCSGRNEWYLNAAARPTPPETQPLGQAGMGRVLAIRARGPAALARG